MDVKTRGHVHVSPYKQRLFSHSKLIDFNLLESSSGPLSFPSSNKLLKLIMTSLASAKLRLQLFTPWPPPLITVVNTYLQLLRSLLRLYQQISWHGVLRPHLLAAQQLSPASNKLFSTEPQRLPLEPNFKIWAWQPTLRLI
ncbi:hypothetical protein EYC80_001092 [Monilinia laxa]|uniref:Uncharacterized protein n=1 Tax=Monilinia laxa TaxID=61186 RepID=A0A5N6K863_MONLA|nr:hypothetical protein EYC80_001092 [Monilinia laxa]